MVSFQVFEKMSVVLLPPKPKEFDITWFTGCDSVFRQGLNDSSGMGALKFTAGSNI
jgi:hypothetical protein